MPSCKESKPLEYGTDRQRKKTLAPAPPHSLRSVNLQYLLIAAACTQQHQHQHLLLPRPKAASKQAATISKGTYATPCNLAQPLALCFRQPLAGCWVATHHPGRSCVKLWQHRAPHALPAYPNRNRSQVQGTCAGRIYGVLTSVTASGKARQGKIKQPSSAGALGAPAPTVLQASCLQAITCQHPEQDSSRRAVSRPASCSPCPHCFRSSKIEKSVCLTLTPFKALTPTVTCLPPRQKPHTGITGQTPVSHATT